MQNLFEETGLCEQRSQIQSSCVPQYRALVESWESDCDACQVAGGTAVVGDPANLLERTDIYYNVTIEKAQVDIHISCAF